jgi:hypothetical protein
MKKAFLTLFLGSMFFVGMGQTDKAATVTGSGPMLSVDKEVHDYGTIAQGANGTCEFNVTNTGDAPLIINNCKGSCGCTVPKCDTKPVAPGQSTVITVRYDTKRVGPINKSVTITSNAANSPTKVVRIKGTVEAAPTTPTTPVKEASPMAPVEKAGS